MSRNSIFGAGRSNRGSSAGGCIAYTSYQIGLSSTFITPVRSRPLVLFEINFITFTTCSVHKTIMAITLRKRSQFFPNDFLPFFLIFYAFLSRNFLTENSNFTSFFVGYVDIPHRNVIRLSDRYPNREFHFLVFSYVTLK